MRAKHERLPTNALILASRNGFTTEARDAAASYGIAPVALSEVDKCDFPTLLGPTSSLWTKSFIIAAEKVLVGVLPTPTLPQETVAVAPENLVYSSNGNELCQIREAVVAALNSLRMRQTLMSEGREDHDWFEMVFGPPRDSLGKPLFLKMIDPETLREIESIKIRGWCKFQITQFGLRGGRLGDVHLAWGKAEVLGGDAIAVATKDAAGFERISISFAGKPPIGPANLHQG
jgi:hypothetical protein